MKCSICKENRPTFSIEVISEDGENKDKHHVCGSCWDIVAEISKVIMGHHVGELKEKISILEDKLQALDDVLYRINDLEADVRNIRRNS